MISKLKADSISMAQDNMLTFIGVCDYRSTCYYRFLASAKLLMWFKKKRNKKLNVAVHACCSRLPGGRISIHFDEIK